MRRALPPVLLVLAAGSACASTGSSADATIPEHTRRLELRLDLDDAWTGFAGSEDAAAETVTEDRGLARDGAGYVVRFDLSARDLPPRAGEGGRGARRVFRQATWSLAWRRSKESEEMVRTLESPLRREPASGAVGQEASPELSTVDLAGDWLAQRLHRSADGTASIAPEELLRWMGADEPVRPPLLFVRDGMWQGTTLHVAPWPEVPQLAALWRSGLHGDARVEPASSRRDLRLSFDVGGEVPLSRWVRSALVGPVWLLRWMLGYTGGYSWRLHGGGSVSLGEDGSVTSVSIAGAIEVELDATCSYLWDNPSLQRLTWQRRESWRGELSYEASNR